MIFFIEINKKNQNQKAFDDIDRLFRVHSIGQCSVNIQVLYREAPSMEPIDSIVIDVLDQIQTIVSANERRQSVPEEHLKGDLSRGILLERL